MENTGHSRLANYNGIIGAMVPNQTNFFASYSKYKQRFSFDDIDRALSQYVAHNPLFPSYTLREHRVERPESVTFDFLQDLVETNFDGYASGFKVVHINFDNDPHSSAFACAFPFSKMDGFTCFKFHQKLVRSVTSRRDCFEVKSVLERLGLDFSDFPAAPPFAFSREAQAACKRPRFSDERMRPMKVLPITERAFSTMGSDYTKKVFGIKNSLPTEPVTLGNYLLYAGTPFQSKLDPAWWRSQLGAQYAENMREAETCGATHEDRTRLTVEVINRTCAHGFVLNNYGDVRSIAAETMVDYRWLLPVMFYPVIVGGTLTLTHHHGSQLTFFDSGPGMYL